MTKTRKIGDDELVDLNGAGDSEIYDQKHDPFIGIPAPPGASARPPEEDTDSGGDQEFGE